MLQRPLAVGLKVCKHAILEADTKHVSLVNCYRWLRFKSFPSPPQSFTVCVVLTDGLGEAELSLQISALAAWEEEERLIRRVWKQNFVDPLRETWFLVPFSQLSFPRPGRYLFALSAEGSEIANTVLDVQENAK